MIVIAILAILFVGVVGTFGARGCGGLAGSKEKARANMTAFANEMGWKLVGGTCAGTDSDGDGYISCTANIQEVEGAPPVVKAIECASGSAVSITEGCRLAKGVYQP